MLDCKSGFHQSEDNRDKRNCHIYVTSIMILTLLLENNPKKTHAADWLKMMIL